MASQDPERLRATVSAQRGPGAINGREFIQRCPSLAAPPVRAQIDFFEPQSVRRPQHH
jgi:hypothetical protein